MTRQLVNPYTGMPFAGNQIPVSMISPVAQKLAALYFPPPNYGSPTLQAGNFRDLLRPGISGTTIFDKFDARIDHNFRSGDAVFARFSFSRVPLDGYVRNAVPPLGRRISVRNANSAVVSWTHSFAPAVWNEFRAGYTRDHNLIQSGVVGSDILRQVGLEGIAVSGIPTYPILSVSGLTPAGQVANFLGSGTNRATLSNAFNHPNFGLPAADIESPGTFGKVTGTYAPLLGQNARQIDFMLRLAF